MIRKTPNEAHTQPCRHQVVRKAAIKPEMPIRPVNTLIIVGFGTMLKKVRLRSGSGSLRKLSMAAAETPCASIKTSAKNTCRKTVHWYIWLPSRGRRWNEQNEGYKWDFRVRR